VEGDGAGAGKKQDPYREAAVSYNTLISFLKNGFSAFYQVASRGRPSEWIALLACRSGQYDDSLDRLFVMRSVVPYGFL
jgi:hypothetical protein